MVKNIESMLGILMLILGIIVFFDSPRFGILSICAGVVALSSYEQ